jgi:uncharacterized membrane protein (Fun14 family)
MQIPIIGEIGLNTIILLGLSGICGFILGSQIRSGLKIILILFIGAFAFGLLTPENLKSLVSLYTTLQPILSDLTQKFGSSTEPALASFSVGLVAGLWKG